MEIPFLAKKVANKSLIVLLEFLSEAQMSFCLEVSNKAWEILGFVSHNFLGRQWNLNTGRASFIGSRQRRECPPALHLQCN